MYLWVAERRRQKLDDRKNTDIRRGLVERSNMALVETTNGIVKVNCINILPTKEAKDTKHLISTRSCFHRLSPGDDQNE